MNCPNCGAACTETQNFCIQCGVSLYRTQPKQKGSHRAPLLILLILSVAGIAVFFASQWLSGVTGSCFEIEDGTLMFYEEYYSGTETVTVPELLEGQTVTSIGSYCFAGCSGIAEVVLPNTVTVLEDYAFASCSALRAMQLPDSVSAIGPGAFDSCDSLEAIYIPVGTVFIAEDAFDDCPSLSHIFYGGTYAQWLRLYGAYADASVCVYCSDGNYQWGFPIP